MSTLDLSSFKDIDILENEPMSEHISFRLGGTADRFITVTENEAPALIAQLNSAKEKGAEEVITACPLCLYNLQVNGENILPVKYFTELLAEALGVEA